MKGLANRFALDVYASGVATIHAGHTHVGVVPESRAGIGVDGGVPDLFFFVVWVHVVVFVDVDAAFVGCWGYNWRGRWNAAGDRSWLLGRSRG